MITKQLYANENPIYPEMDINLVNIPDKQNMLGGGEVSLQQLIDVICDSVANKLLQKSQIADWAKAPTKPLYTAVEVGADGNGSASAALTAAKEYADDTYTQATGYTDYKITELIGGESETLTTIKAIADEIAANETIIEALNAAIGSKASEVEYQAHAGNRTMHVTASEKNGWNEAVNAVANIQTAVTAEVAERKAEDAAIRTKIADEIATEAYLRAASVNNEATARTKGDATLETAIAEEATNRKNADSALQSAITEEATNRFWEDAVIRELAAAALPKSGGTIEGLLITQDLVVAPLQRAYFPYDAANPYIGARVYSPERQRFIFGASNEDNYLLQIGVLESAWTFCPLNGNGTVRLGSPNRRWGQIYSTVATISTSDRREKEDIETINYEDIKAFLQDLTPVYYRLIADPSKKYAGLIAQDVEQLMIKHNIPEDFGLLDKNPVYDDEGKPTGDYVYGLCYEQLITLMLLTIQQEGVLK